MNQKKSRSNTLWVLIILLSVLLGIGTIGFISLNDYSPWEAFYQTIIILFTHFYHQINEPLPTQVLILFLIIGSLIVVAYIIKFFAEYFFEGAFKERRRRAKMNKKINSLNNHYIICGYGRIGKQVAEELSNEKIDFVIADRDPKVIAEAMNQGYLVVNGCPTEEQTLMNAGILRAKSVIVAIGMEIRSLYVVISARSLNPDVFIIARVGSEGGVPKLKKAGADKIILPEQIAGYHMATMALRPAVVDFLDVVADGKRDDIQIEEYQIEHGSSLVDRPISFFSSEVAPETSVLAITRSDGSKKVNPRGDEIMGLGDKLILMGASKQLNKISEKK